MAALPRTVSAGRPGRWAAAVLGSLGLLTVTACGFNVQTNQPYTPAQGVNGSVGDVKYRNLLVLSRATGDGFLSGSLVADSDDALTAVSGAAIKADGSDGPALTGSVPTPVTLSSQNLVILTQRPLIVLTGADLEPGLTARVTLQFSKAGQVTTVAPVVDAATQGEFATISPSAAPSAG